MNQSQVLDLIFQQPDVAPQFLHVGHCLASPLVKMGLAFAPRPSPVRCFRLALAPLSIAATSRPT
jgi:hypothetical protein